MSSAIARLNRPKSVPFENITVSSDVLSEATMEEVLDIASRRKILMSKMRQACLDDNISELKRVAEIYCGLREDE